VPKHLPILSSTVTVFRQHLSARRRTSSFATSSCFRRCMKGLLTRPASSRRALPILLQRSQRAVPRVNVTTLHPAISNIRQLDAPYNALSLIAWHVETDSSHLRYASFDQFLPYIRCPHYQPVRHELHIFARRTDAGLGPPNAC
jgi:hypothetical protein